MVSRSRDSEAVVIHWITSIKTDQDKRRVLDLMANPLPLCSPLDDGTLRRVPSTEDAQSGDLRYCLWGDHLTNVEWFCRCAHDACKSCHEERGQW